MAWFPANLIRQITAAFHDAAKLPTALVSSGVFLIVSALALLVSKRPSAVLITWHGSAAAYTYYGFVGGTVAFGFAEGFFGLWADLRRWSLTAKVLLSVSLMPLAVVLALWAGLRL